MFPAKKILSLVLSIGLLGLVACGGSGPSETMMKDVVKNYAAIVYASYSDVEKGVVALQTAVNALIASPSADTLKKAREEWKAVRVVYGQTEVYRFYDGPIDNENGPEGQMNAWPMDEAWVDYTKDDPDAGIINKVAKYPTITKQLLIDQNEKNEDGGDNEKNISTGFHAIEFLLWGQDLSKTGPGARPHTDFVKGGTAKNQERRATYLKVATELLLDDIRKLQAAWAPDKTDNYAAKFLALPPKEAITKIILGMGKLSLGELAGERMSAPYNEKDQEEEHSCFSDNTHVDMIQNAAGVQNVFLGKYGSVTGPGIYDLVKAADADLAEKMKTEIAASVNAAKAIPVPFDQAMLGDDNADGRKKMKATIDALTTQTQSIAEAAAKLQLQLNLQSFKIE